MVLTSGAVICLSVHERREAVLESLALGGAYGGVRHVACVAAGGA